MAGSFPRLKWDLEGSYKDDLGGYEYRPIPRPDTGNPDDKAEFLESQLCYENSGNDELQLL